MMSTGRGGGLGMKTRTYSFIGSPGVQGTNDVKGRDDPIFAASSANDCSVSSIGGEDAPAPGAGARERRRRQRDTETAIKIATTATTPPMTPPTIAPVFELCEGVADPVGDVLGDVDTSDGPRIVPGPTSGESVKKKWM